MLVLTPYKNIFYSFVRERTILNILDIGVKLLLDLSKMQALPRILTHQGIAYFLNIRRLQDPSDEKD